MGGNTERKGDKDGGEEPKYAERVWMMRKEMATREARKECVREGCWRCMLVRVERRRRREGGSDPRSVEEASPHLQCQVLLHIEKNLSLTGKLLIPVIIFMSRRTSRSQVRESNKGVTKEKGATHKVSEEETAVSGHQVSAEPFQHEQKHHSCPPSMISWSATIECDQPLSHPPTTAIGRATKRS
jgi:hypothetical protein